MFAMGAASLHLDGILLVKGMSMDSARVIVVSADAAPRVITEGLAHFTLELDLQGEYLISFERPGCVSKALQFNTRVPAGQLAGEGFYFPFQVTLAPPASGQHFAYAGPVGYIHFDPGLQAFGYDTDYRIAKNEVLTKRLELVHAQLERPALSEARPVSPAGKVEPPLPDRPNDRREEGDAPGRYHTLAPVVSEVAPKVHVLEVPDLPREALAEASKPKEAAQPVPEAQRAGTPPGEGTSVPVQPQTMASLDRGGHYSKSVEADQLHVITTITFDKDGSRMEYRRVVSYYGGTTYFCNGAACSEATYIQGISP